MKRLDYILLKVQEHNAKLNPKKKQDYEGRMHYEMWHYGINTKGPLYGCGECNFMTKSEHAKCPNCGHSEMVNLGYKARPPRKKASKKKWKQFWEMFGV